MEINIQTKTNENKLLSGGFNKIKGFITNTFETRSDILTAFAVLLFLAANVMKISVFNQLIVPNADKWMFRYKIITTLLLVVITYPILFRFRSRVLFISFYILQVLYILVNMSYYLYFDNYLHVEQFVSNFFEGFKAVQNASAPKNPILLIAVMDLPFFVYLLVKWFRANRLHKKLRILIYITVILAVGVTAWNQHGNWKEHNFLTQIAKNPFLGESRIVQRYGTLINNGVSLYNNRNTEDYIKSFKYGRDRTNTSVKEKKPNFFIVQVEGFDAAIVQQKYKGNYIMPYLNSMTDKSVYYPYMMSYHLGGGTSDAEFSVINSIEPLTTYPSIKLTTYKGPNSFLTRMTKESYAANAFHGNIGRYYNRDLAFPKYGFNEYYDIAKMNLKDVGWGAPDDQLLKFVLDKSSTIKEPFLSYAITMTSHIPYTNAYNYYNNAAYKDIKDDLVRGYFNSMSYVDETMKNFIESVQKEYDNTYIFIYGDHTRKIDNAQYKQSAVKIDGKTYEFVPLFIITPDKQVYHEQKKAASFLDVGITILNASGIQYSIKSDGSDLLAPEKIEGKIPYRGLQWDREELFNKIAEALK